MPVFRRFFALVGIVAVTSCATSQSPSLSLGELKGGAEIALRRGASWATLTVRLPHVIGAASTLRISRGHMTGMIDGGSVNLLIEKDTISGTGPGGTVSVDVDETDEGTEVSGTWSGNRVSFKVSADSFRGVIAIRTGRTQASLGTCQYVLDRTEADGARTGTSICSGLPEETRLEIPSVVYAWLTRTEMAVVLLALLSAPPYTLMEPHQPF